VSEVFTFENVFARGRVYQCERRTLTWGDC